MHMGGSTVLAASDPDFLIVQLVIMLICGGIAAAIATAKGRSGAWFFAGFFIGIIGIIIIACMPNLKEQKERQELENRRLREQLRQEQIKSEAFRQHAALRLDVHDEHLGVNTRSISALPCAASPQHQLASGGPAALDGELSGTHTPPLPPTRGDAVAPASRTWHYEAAGESRGPVTDRELVSLIRSGVVQRQTLVWTQELPDWTPADRVGNLNPLFA
jgi:type II secretory pathway pseudopilin PulG